jgi:hypothetical protein
MKLDPGMHIGMHLVSFGKSGVTRVVGGGAGSLTAGTWRPGRTLRVAMSVLAEVTYAVVAPRRPMGKRGPDTERSPVGAAAVSPVVASALRLRLSRALAEELAALRRRRARSVHLSGRRGTCSGRDGGRVGPSLTPRTEFVAVGDTHEVAVPRGLKVQAPEPDFEPGWEGVRAAHGIPLAAVLGVNHHR